MSLLSDKYGGAVLQVASPDASTLHTAAVHSNGDTSPLSAESPMLWLVGIGAVLLGLASFSTSGRVGPAKFSASI